VHVSDDQITAMLTDGRTISVPLAWSWRLSEATAAQRTNFRLIAGGQGVHWPEIDEDISVWGCSLIGVGELTGFGLRVVKCSTVASPGYACAVDPAIRGEVRNRRLAGSRMRS
jgi:hypothetical protein